MNLQERAKRIIYHPVNKGVTQTLTCTCGRFHIFSRYKQTHLKCLCGRLVRL